MAIRDVRKDPDPILRQKAKVVPSKKIRSPEIQEIITDMVDTMKYAKGIGIAAPQVGESLRIIVVQYNGRILTLVNPKIIKKSWSKVTTEEGCLSVPGIFGRCRRNRSVTVKARNATGAKVIIPATGLESIIVQHEIDHLNGVLFTDRVKGDLAEPKQL